MNGDKVEKDFLEEIDGWEVIPSDMGKALKPPSSENCDENTQESEVFGVEAKSSFRLLVFKTPPHDIITVKYPMTDRVKNIRKIIYFRRGLWPRTPFFPIFPHFFKWLLTIKSEHFTSNLNVSICT